MIVLPFIPSVADYTFTTTIESVAHRFRVRWNSRDQAWFFDVETEDGVVLRQGVKIVLGAFLGRGGTEGIFADGVIVARDTTSQAKEAGFDDITTRVEVLYLTALEVQGILEGELVP